MNSPTRRFNFRSLGRAMAASLACAFSLSAFAGTLEAGIGAQGGTGQGCFLVNTANKTATTGPMTLSHGCNEVSFNGAMTGAITTLVDYGLVATHAEITAQSNRPFNISNNVVVASQARADYQFRGPAGSTFTSLNLAVQGQFDAPPQPFGARVLANGIDRSYTAGVIDEVLHGQSFEVSTLAPTSILLSLRISIGTGSFDGSLQSVGVSGPDDYFQVGFARGGPVFNLPAGFTVNGPCVTDNRYVCSPALAPVPLPAALWLFAPALGVLARRRRAQLVGQFPVGAN